MSPRESKDKAGTGLLDLQGKPAVGRSEGSHSELKFSGHTCSFLQGEKKGPTSEAFYTFTRVTHSDPLGRHAGPHVKGVGGPSIIFKDVLIMKRPLLYTGFYFALLKQFHSRPREKKKG